LHKRWENVGGNRIQEKLVTKKDFLRRKRARTRRKSISIITRGKSAGKRRENLSGAGMGDERNRYMTFRP